MLFLLFLLITFIPAITGQHNYLCNFDTKFTSNSVGNWQTSTDSCQVKQSADDVGAVAWMGEIDPTTLSWTDYTIESTMQFDWSDGYVSMGIIFRANSIGNNWYEGGYYYSAIGTDDGGQFMNSEFNSNYYLKRNTISREFVPYTDYTIRIEVNGSSWTTIVDGQQISYTDSSFPSGSIGLRTSGTSATFKTLFISGVPTWSPTAAPSAAPTVIPSGYSSNSQSI